MFLSHLTKRLSLQLLIFDQLQADVVLVAGAQPADLRLQALVLVALQVSRDLVLLQLFRLGKFRIGAEAHLQCPAFIDPSNLLRPISNVCAHVPSKSLCISIVGIYILI